MSINHRVAGFGHGDRAPAAASGATWQMDRPDVPPENPPVGDQGAVPAQPFPLRKLVGYSISCIPARRAGLRSG